MGGRWIEFQLWGKGEYSTINEKDILHILNKAVNNLAKLNSIYLEAPTVKKRQIAG